MPELCIIGDVVGMPNLYITGDLVGMPELCNAGEFFGMHEIRITADFLGMPGFHIKCLRNNVTIKKWPPLNYVSSNIEVLL